MSKDTVYRQDAIDGILGYMPVELTRGASTAEQIVHSIWRTAISCAESYVRRMPSAEPEIIRCKDCKHSEHWYGNKRRCFLWHDSGIDVFEDGFCNYAERRTDG